MTLDTSPVLGLLLSRDVFFASKVTGTASALGLLVETRVDPSQACAEMTASPPRCVFLDLAMADLVVEQVTNALGPDRTTKLVAFGPHVDVERLAEAEKAGCDLVLPRSRFSSTLPQLLQEAFAPR